MKTLTKNLEPVEQLEEELKERQAKKEKKKMKVQGRGVFELQKIIKDKCQRPARLKK